MDHRLETWWTRPASGLQVAALLAILFIPCLGAILFSCNGVPVDVEACVIYQSDVGDVKVCVVKRPDGSFSIKSEGKLSEEDVKRIKEKLGVK